MSQNRFLLRNVTCQMEQYSAYAEEAGTLLKHHGVIPEKRSAVKKLISRTGAQLNTLFDSSDRHVALLIEKGTELGADSLEKTVCRLENAGVEGDALSLARRVVEFERREENRMKDFT